MSKTLADHLAALELVQGQPARTRHAYAVRLNAAQTRVEQPPMPDLDSYIAAKTELLILEKLIEDHDFNSPDVHSSRAGDSYIVANVAELVPLLHAKLADQTKSKKSVVAGIAAKVGELGAKMISAITPADAEKARAAREKLEDEAAGIELDIAAAVTAIRTLEIEPSLQTFNAADGYVSRVNLPTAKA